MIHELKCWPEPFQAIVDRRKKFEFRDARDRHFTVGDTLRIMEWDPRTKEYTKREVHCTVTYLLDFGFGIPDGYCVMSIDVFGGSNIGKRVSMP